MAMGYMYEEALGFVTEHFRMYPIAARLIWDMDEDEQDSGEVLEGHAKKRRWDDDELHGLHEFIIRNSDVTDGLYK